MEITQEYRDLIQNIIKSNNRFSGNEDLFEDFCSETIKRSYRIVSSINNINNLEGYLNKVATSAILEVLKNSGRLRKSSSGYVQTKEVVQVQDKASECDVYIDLVQNIPDDSVQIEEDLINKEFFNNVLSKLYSIDALEKEKNFLTLFELRYVKALKQSEIAEELNISQGEVSKRLVELSKKIADSLQEDNNQTSLY